MTDKQAPSMFRPEPVGEIESHDNHPDSNSRAQQGVAEVSVWHLLAAFPRGRLPGHSRERLPRIRRYLVHGRSSLGRSDDVLRILIIASRTRQFPPIQSIPLRGQSGREAGASGFAPRSTPSRSPSPGNPRPFLRSASFREAPAQRREELLLVSRGFTRARPGAWERLTPKEKVVITCG